MGTTTPNISLYIPADGETNYGSAFSNGMLNLDTHDHSGAPNNGVPIATSGLADGSVTRNKLNSNVVLAGGGLAVDVGSPNALKADGLLLALFGLGSNGILVRTSGTTASSRTIITANSARLTVSNGDGVAGNPSLNLPNIPDLLGVNASGGTFALQAGGVTQANLTSGLLDLSPGVTAISSYQTITGLINAGNTQDLNTIGDNQIWLYTAIEDPSSPSYPENTYKAAALVFSQNNTVAETYTTLANSNIEFQASGVNLKVQIKNTSVANRIFKISAIRLM